MTSDELVEQAKRDAEDRAGGWGMRIQLEVGEHWAGRYRGDTIASGGDYGDQTLFLFWDEGGYEVYMRGHASLVAKMAAAAPQLGDTVVVYRSDDYQSAGGTGYAYGVAREPNDAPLPDTPSDTFATAEPVADDVEW